MDGFDSFGFGSSTSFRPSQPTTNRRSSAGGPDTAGGAGGAGGGGSGGGGGGKGRTTDGTAQRTIPVTISMLQQSFRKLEQESHGNVLLIHNCPVAAVVLRGFVLSVDFLASQVKFRLGDGTGSLVEVQYDIEEKGQKEEGQFPPVSLLRPGCLVRVVGPVSRMDEGEGKRMCCVHACHVLVMVDRDEYVCFAATDVCYETIRMTESKEEGENGEGEKQQRKQEMVSEKEEPKSGGWEDTWPDVSLPADFEHITENTQCDLLRLLLTHPRGRDNGISREMIFGALKKKHREAEIDDAIAQMAEEGEISEMGGSTYRLP